MNTDPIADMLNRIGNAKKARHEQLTLPYSKIKMEILKVMESNRFIEKVSINKLGQFQHLEIKLSSTKDTISLKRVSKPGQRIYIKADEIRSVLNGLGMTILSTPKGVMSGKDARKHKVGGELLCEIY
ncbi:MAG: small subunit ribosomal protein S8 [uncultured bacterium]|nr:MAG: small subunit ribosomal protein S8 [uncultured bacterium]KKT75088.1 MAG: 30S ribosomal protein S8 [Candidatus Peregrinibacteria bacterium GW2011_GWA2_44_7]